MHALWSNRPRSKCIAYEKFRLSFHEPIHISFFSVPVGDGNVVEAKQRDVGLRFSFEHGLFFESSYGVMFNFELTEFFMAA